MNTSDSEYLPRPEPSPTPVDSSPPIASAEIPGELTPTPIVSRGSLIALIGLVIAADWCLYATWGGTGVAVFNLIAGACLLYLAPEQIRTRPLLLGGAIAMLAIACIWHAWWLPMFIIFAALGLLGVCIHRPEWNLLETGWASLTALIPGRHIRPFMNRLGEILRSRLRGKRMPGFPVRAIATPLLITLFFVWIFSRANSIVNWIAAGFFREIIGIIRFAPDYLSFSRILFWLMAFILLAALLHPVFRSRLLRKMLSVDPQCQPNELSVSDRKNFQAAMSTLICMNLLFFAYNALDSVYLYFKSTLPAGMNWTEYTHSGCGWLTFALFSSSAVLAAIFWNSLNFHPDSSRLKRLAYFWVAQNGILAIGAMRRLQMYIDYSGLTHLIITGIYGSLLVTAGLLIMARKVQRNHSAMWLLRRYVSAFCTGVLILAITPYGYVCAKFNVPRVLEDKPNALWPIVLKKQPADALPLLLPLLDYERADGDIVKQTMVRRGVAATIGLGIRKLESQARNPWQYRQASTSWALPQLYEAFDRILEICPEYLWVNARAELSSNYDLMSGSQPAMKE